MESMMKNKHAYLIIAHNKFEQLAFLVSLLDYKHHDIYILVDKKSDFSAEVKIRLLRWRKSQISIFLKNALFIGADILRLKQK